MAKLPEDLRLKTEKLIEDGEIVQGFRPYLGASGIGTPCSRDLWYGFRLCAVRAITPRINRLFQRGHKEEPIIQEDLRKIGIIHHSDQKEINFCWGHGKGHIDDILENVPDAPKTPHLGEYKTHNDKSFKDLIKKGMRVSKPMHYAQMIIYMHKLKLTRGLYIAVNKNDDSRYYERVSANPDHAKALLEKGRTIIRAKTPPPKVGNAKWFECKWCDFYQICHFGELPIPTCRTCKNGTIKPEGIWTCSKHDIHLAFDQQILGCKQHKYLECLI